MILLFNFVTWEMILLFNFVAFLNCPLSVSLTHHFVLVVDADPVLDQSPDDVQVALGGRALQGRVAGLEREQEQTLLKKL